MPTPDMRMSQDHNLSLGVQTVPCFGPMLRPFFEGLVLDSEAFFTRFVLGLGLSGPWILYAYRALDTTTGRLLDPNNQSPAIIG